MVRVALRSAVLAVVLAALGAGAASGAALVEVGPEEDWGSELIYATAPPEDGRLFVVERGAAGVDGRIRIVEDGAVLPAPFATVDNLSTNSERGLLSIAFPPDYEESGLLYAFYTAAEPDALDPDGQAGDIRIVELRRSGEDPDRADPSYERLVWKVPHTAGNHNGGWMAFGPDGHLYLTIGDNANSANAQSLANPLGKVLRIDPEPPGGGPGPGHTVPADNPFVGQAGAIGEIYAYGLRNPFRASFTPDGLLAVADVGQGSIEEIDHGDLAGKNMGWPICEGFCDPPQPGLTDPFFAYPHTSGGQPLGCAVLGGYVVRDPDLTGLTGRYVYGDLCASDLRTLDFGVAGGDPAPAGIELPSSVALRSFGEDAGGCVYVVGHDSLFRIAPGPDSSAECPRSSMPGPPGPPDPGPGPGEPPPGGGPQPGPPPDATPPRVTVKRLGGKLRRTVAVRARCSEACELRAVGTVSIRRRPRGPITGGIEPVTRDAPARRFVRLRLTMRKPLLRRARAAVRAGRAVVVRVRVGAVDAAGNVGKDSATVVIRRARR